MNAWSFWSRYIPATQTRRSSKHRRRRRRDNAPKTRATDWYLGPATDLNVEQDSEVRLSRTHAPLRQTYIRGQPEQREGRQLISFVEPSTPTASPRYSRPWSSFCDTGSWGRSRDRLRLSMPGRTHARTHAAWWACGICREVSCTAVVWMPSNQILSDVPVRLPAGSPGYATESAHPLRGRTSQDQALDPGRPARARRAHARSR